MLFAGFLLNSHAQEEQPNLAGQLDRCQADLKTCQSSFNTEPLKSERDKLIADNRQLQQVNITLSSDIFNTPGAKRAQEIVDSAKNDRHPTFSYQEGRARYKVTNLVIGTLKLTQDPAEVSLDGSSRLILEFEPRSIGPFGATPDISWYIRAAFEPKALKADYEQAASGNKQEARKLALSNNQKETWIWTVRPLEGFEKEKTEVICYLRYDPVPSNLSPASKPNTYLDETEIWRQTADWTKAPGLFDRIGQWFSQHVVAVVSGLTAWIGLIVALITLVKARLEVKKLRSGTP